MAKSGPEMEGINLTMRNSPLQTTSIQSIQSFCADMVSSHAKTLQSPMKGNGSEWSDTHLEPGFKGPSISICVSNQSLTNLENGNGNSAEEFIAESELTTLKAAAVSMPHHGSTRGKGAFRSSNSDAGEDELPDAQGILVKIMEQKSNFTDSGCSHISSESYESCSVDVLSDAMGCDSCNRGKFTVDDILQCVDVV